MDNDIFHSGDQGFRNEEIIQPPAYPALTSGEAICPPGILDAVWVKMSVGIHKSVVDELLHPRSLLRQKARCFHVLFRVFQVNWHMQIGRASCRERVCVSWVRGSSR